MFFPYECETIHVCEMLGEMCVCVLLKGETAQRNFENVVSYFHNP